jgi:hypothetical protein
VPQRDAVHEHESEENKRAAHKKRKEQKKRCRWWRWIQHMYYVSVEILVYYSERRVCHFDIFY